MTSDASTSPQSTQNQQQETKTNDKELNFRALESKYRQQLEAERAEKLELARQLDERSKAALHDEEDESEPYVDHKKLNKTLSKFQESNSKQTKNEIQQAVNHAIKEERKQSWLKNNSDFYDVLQQHADKLLQADPELAETILEMPEGFERQKLVYKNIKALGLHQPLKKDTSVQDKIDANRRSPYYQPSGVGTASYSPQGDYSQSGQKQAYEKMQALKNQLRLG